MEEISSLIARKMEAESCKLHARNGMEQARQAMEFYERQVETINREIAALAIRNTGEEDVTM